MVQEALMKGHRHRGGLREPTRDVFTSHRGQLKGARKIMVLLEAGDNCGEGGACQVPWL